MMAFHEIVAVVSRAIEAAGVAIVVVGAFIATVVCFGRPNRGPFEARYTEYRQWLGRAILLGLEFLVAADIIGTVTISPTLTSVGILAAIVLIRTFLSVALAVEIEGRWPWARGVQL
jgi:uncharacterized membrane protein